MTAVLKLFKTHPNVIIPEFKTAQSACFDLEYNPCGKNLYTGFSQYNKAFTRPYNPKDLSAYIGPKERIMIPTGIIMDIPAGYSVRVHSRSSVAFKLGINLSNNEGVIDSDYFEEIWLLLTNNSETGYTIQYRDRLAQAELVKQESYELKESLVKPVQKTDRVGGVGSTGKGKSVDNTPKV